MQTQVPVVVLTIELVGQQAYTVTVLTTPEITLNPDVLHKHWYPNLAVIEGKNPLLHKHSALNPLA